MIIRELTPSDLREAYPLVRQLRPHLSEGEFIETATEMISQGYTPVALFDGAGDGEKISAYAGYAELLNLYYGRHIWIYELVVDENERGKGLGKILLSHIEKIACEKKLNCIALSSGVQKESAHRFYAKNEYEKVSFVYKKFIG
ncbi:MAG: GNAT family N-acetyltransferase [Defluviitaleaceae bacterium]|nr:GNAT family N-acetyltransferase [Defluviitaleaceae bacterium]